MPTFYHLEGEKCPECGEVMLMFANYDDGRVVLECDDLGAPGCGKDFGIIGQADSREEAEAEAHRFLS